MSRLVARPLSAEDLPHRVDWFNTPAIHAQMTIEVPLTLERTRAWFERARANDARRDFTFDLVTERGGTEPAAMGGLLEIDRTHGHAELYILASPGRLGQGIGSRATRWLCNHAFAALDLHRVYLFTLGSNEGARRMYQCLGFVHEGILREHVLHSGRHVDRHVQSILRAEWSALPWREGPPLSGEVA